MKLTIARKMAKDLMKEHGLVGWRFSFNNRKNGLGLCMIQQKMIQLSRPITKLNTEERMKYTILHEIAHALTGCNHNWRWKQKCMEIGGDGKISADAAEVIAPKGKVEYKCIKCSHLMYTHRRCTRRFGCPKCTIGRRFDDASEMKLVED